MILSGSLFFILLLSSCSTSHSLQEDPLVAIQLQDRNGITETISIPERLESLKKIDYLKDQPYQKVTRIFREETQNHSKITTYHANGGIYQYLETRQMRACGAYREWFPNGQQKVEATVIGGTANLTKEAQADWLFDGTCFVWSEGGILLAEIPYEKGRLQGMSRYFFPTGVLQKECPFQNHLLHGERRLYYPEGTLQESSSYHFGKKEGLSRGFFPSGKLCFEEEYRENLLEQGRYISKDDQQLSFVQQGNGTQTIFERFHPICRKQIQHGVVEGLIESYTSQGKLESTYSLKNGLKHGEEILYYLNTPTAIPKLSIHWDKADVHGMVKTWYQEGTLQSQREYCRNKKHGPSCSWYKDGSMMLFEEYDNNRLISGSYYQKGKKEPVASVVQGSGKACLYDEDGIFLKKVTYVDGKPSTDEE